MKPLLLLLLLLLATPTLAQRQNNVWYFGHNAGIDFNGDVPVILEDGKTFIPEGTASIADARTGSLLFYTDGVTVWNALHLPMSNGTGLMGDASSTQSALIVPMPGSRSKYYIFTTGIDRSQATWPWGNRYSIVDMALDGGHGGVIEKNRLLHSPSVQSQSAYHYCGSPEEIWMIGHGLRNNAFYAYRITEAGIAPPVISHVGHIRDWVGSLVFSPDGSMIASTDAMYGFVELYRFDRATGILSRPLLFPVLDPLQFTPRGVYGACFSPDNSKLYVSVMGHGVLQFDISLADSSRIARSATWLATNAVVKGSMQLGPDGRIYIAATDAVDVIQFPDSAGPACGYIPGALAYTTAHPALSLPNLLYSNMDLYRAEVSTTVRICYKDSAQLTASGGVGYQWSPSTGLSCTDCPNPIASPGETTTYTVAIASRYGCPLIDSVTVEIIPLSTIDAGAAREICMGDSVRLAATGTGSYFWSPAAGLSCVDCPDPVASPATTTLYRLRLTGPEGCSAEDSVLVTVYPIPVADAAATDTTICAGSAVQLTAAGGERYRWSPAAGLSCVDCSDPVATPTVTTTYHLTAFNAIDCAAFDSVTIHVDAVPSLMITGDTTLCRGESTTLTATGADSYRWSPADDLSCVDCATPVATPARTITYYLTGTGSNGCERLDSVRIEVAEPPALKLSGDSTICSGSQGLVVATGAETYLWSSPGRTLDCPTCPEQVISPTGSIKLYVEGKSKEGCVSIDSFEVTLRQSADLVVTGGGEICSGESRMLHASGAASYRWEPASGLSCIDCPNPVASPMGTTVYQVVGSLPGGCSDTAMVTLTVRERERAIATIDRDAALAIGESRALRLRIDRAITADTLFFELGWRRGVVAFENLQLAAALLAEGWMEVQQSKSDAGYRSRFVRASPGVVPAGELATLTLSGYLGDSTASELPFSLIANSICTAIETPAGSITIDSICGLDMRMIVAMKGMLRLDLPSPHPVVGHGTIRYAVPFDADDVELMLIDATGQSRLLGGGHHSAGEYEIVLNTARTAPGLYQLRLRIGRLIRQVEVIVVR